MNDSVDILFFQRFVKPLLAKQHDFKINIQALLISAQIPAWVKMKRFNKLSANSLRQLAMLISKYYLTSNAAKTNKP